MKIRNSRIKILNQLQPFNVFTNTFHYQRHPLSWKQSHCAFHEPSSKSYGLQPKTSIGGKLWIGWGRHPTEWALRAHPTQSNHPLRVSQEWPVSVYRAYPNKFQVGVRKVYFCFAIKKTRDSRVKSSNKPKQLTMWLGCRALRMWPYGSTQPIRRASFVGCVPTDESGLVGPMGPNSSIGCGGEGPQGPTLQLINQPTHQIIYKGWLAFIALEFLKKASNLKNLLSLFFVAKFSPFERYKLQKQSIQYKVPIRNGCTFFIIYVFGSFYWLYLNSDSTKHQKFNFEKIGFLFQEIVFETLPLFQKSFTNSTKETIENTTLTIPEKSKVLNNQFLFNLEKNETFSYLNLSAFFREFSLQNYIGRIKEKKNLEQKDLHFSNQKILFKTINRIKKQKFFTINNSNNWFLTDSLKQQEVKNLLLQKGPNSSYKTCDQNLFFFARKPLFFKEGHPNKLWEQQILLQKEQYMYSGTSIILSSDMDFLPCKLEGFNIFFTKKRIKNEDGKLNILKKKLLSEKLGVGEKASTPPKKFLPHQSSWEQVKRYNNFNQSKTRNFKLFLKPTSNKPISPPRVLFGKLIGSKNLGLLAQSLRPCCPIDVALRIWPIGFNGSFASNSTKLVKGIEASPLGLDLVTVLGTSSPNPPSIKPSGLISSPTGKVTNQETARKEAEKSNTSFWYRSLNIPSRIKSVNVSYQEISLTRSAKEEQNFGIKYQQKKDLNFRFPKYSKKFIKPRLQSGFHFPDALLTYKNSKNSKITLKTKNVANNLKTTTSTSSSFPHPSYNFFLEEEQKFKLLKTTRPTYYFKPFNFSLLTEKTNILVPKIPGIIKQEYLKKNKNNSLETVTQNCVKKDPFIELVYKSKNPAKALNKSSKTQTVSAFKIYRFLPHLDPFSLGKDKILPLFYKLRQKIVLFPKQKYLRGSNSSFFRFVVLKKNADIQTYNCRLDMRNKFRGSSFVENLFSYKKNNLAPVLWSTNVPENALELGPLTKTKVGLQSTKYTSTSDAPECFFGTSYLQVGERITIEKLKSKSQIKKIYSIHNGDSLNPVTGFKESPLVSMGNSLATVFGKKQVTQQSSKRMAKSQNPITNARVVSEWEKDYSSAHHLLNKKKESKNLFYFKFVAGKANEQLIHPFKYYNPGTKREKNIEDTLLTLEMYKKSRLFPKLHAYSRGIPFGFLPIETRLYKNVYKEQNVDLQSILGGMRQRTESQRIAENLINPSSSEELQKQKLTQSQFFDKTKNKKNKKTNYATNNYPSRTLFTACSQEFFPEIPVGPLDEMEYGVNYLSSRLHMGRIGWVYRPNGCDSTNELGPTDEVGLWARKDELGGEGVGPYRPSPNLPYNPPHPYGCGGEGPQGLTHKPYNPVQPITSNPTTQSINHIQNKPTSEVRDPLKGQSQTKKFYFERIFSPLTFKGYFYGKQGGGAGNLLDKIFTTQLLISVSKGSLSKLLFFAMVWYSYKALATPLTHSTEFLPATFTEAIGLQSFQKKYRIINGEKTKQNFRHLAGAEKTLSELRDLIWTFNLVGTGSSTGHYSNVTAFPYIGSQAGQQRSLVLSKSRNRFLLIGPPGTGKTLLIKTLAAEAKVPVIVQPVSQLRMIQGVENPVSALFHVARQIKPCIIFLDELDTLGSDIVKTSSSSQDQKLGQKLAQKYTYTLLLELDGLTSSTQDLLVIGATNRPETLNPALTRAGRFDTIINCNLPSQEQRLSVLSLYLSKYKQKVHKISLNTNILGLKKFQKLIFFWLFKIMRFKDLYPTQDKVNFLPESSISNGQNIQLVNIKPYLAKKCYGLSQASIETVVNESALDSMLRNSSSVHTLETLERAIDSVRTLTSKSRNSSAFDYSSENSGTYYSSNFNQKSNELLKKKYNTTTKKQKLEVFSDFRSKDKGLTNSTDVVGWRRQPPHPYGPINLTTRWSQSFLESSRSGKLKLLKPYRSRTLIKELKKSNLLDQQFLVHTAYQTVGSVVFLHKFEKLNNSNFYRFQTHKPKKSLQEIFRTNPSELEIFSGNKVFLDILQKYAQKASGSLYSATKPQTFTFSNKFGLYQNATGIESNPILLNPLVEKNSSIDSLQKTKSKNTANPKIFTTKVKSAISSGLNEAPGIRTSIQKKNDQPKLYEVDGLVGKALQVGEEGLRGRPYGLGGVVGPSGWVGGAKPPLQPSSSYGALQLSPTLPIQPYPSIGCIGEGPLGSTLQSYSPLSGMLYKGQSYFFARQRIKALRVKGVVMKAFPPTTLKFKNSKANGSSMLSLPSNNPLFFSSEPKGFWPKHPKSISKFVSEVEYIKQENGFGGFIKKESLFSENLTSLPLMSSSTSQDRSQLTTQNQLIAFNSTETNQIDYHLKKYFSQQVKSNPFITGWFRVYLSRPFFRYGRCEYIENKEYYPQSNYKEESHKGRFKGLSSLNSASQVEKKAMVLGSRFINLSTRGHYPSSSKLQSKDLLIQKTIKDQGVTPFIKLNSFPQVFEQKTDFIFRKTVDLEQNYTSHRQESVYLAILASLFHKGLLILENNRELLDYCVYNSLRYGVTYDFLFYPIYKRF